MVNAESETASVAKGLRQRIVVPPLVGSNPIVRPYRYGWKPWLAPSVSIGKFKYFSKILRLPKCQFKYGLFPQVFGYLFTLASFMAFYKTLPEPL